ncbi:hypothetical protein ACFWPK_31940 [Nocardia sp. NPDC058519]|uniref:hypothetical protein n=1 Tax=Nocardia sp. NPDC058519 TaxID=3346535 RepID=UPI0036573924
MPEVWWSGDRWVALMMALYDLLYPELRATLRAPSVKRSTFLAWAKAEAGVADHATGRDCRPTLRYLSGKVGRGRRTIQRCRELAGLLDGRQQVFRGRQRTLVERLESHERRDRGRGWASIAALIPSPAYAHLVDNSVLADYITNSFVTPPSRRLGSGASSSTSVVTTHKESTTRRASRGTDKRRVRRKARERDHRAVLLASRVRSDGRMPLWAREIPLRALERVLTSRAVHGWQPDDVYEAVDAIRIAGKRLIGRPDNPIGYLVWVLDHTPADEPPAALARAQAAAEEVERLETQRRDWDDRRAAAQSRPAAPDSSARAAARAVVDQAARHAIGTKATARAASDAARREVARLAREVQ